MLGSPRVPRTPASCDSCASEAYQVQRLRTDCARASAPIQQQCAPPAGHRWALRHEWSPPWLVKECGTPQVPPEGSRPGPVGEPAPYEGAGFIVVGTRYVS